MPSLPVLLGLLSLLLAAAVQARAPATKIRDCSHAKALGYSENGTYALWANGSTPAKVVCEFYGDNAYTVILRRQSASVNFYRGWVDYVNGFGYPSGDYWIGLSMISYLTTTQRQSVLTINMQDWAGHNENVRYNHFVVSDAGSDYSLFVTGFSGYIPDDLSYNSGMRFATYDRPDKNQCASYQKGGWWYNYCTYTLPTGVYYTGGKYVPPGSMADGIFWNHWLGVDYSLKFFQMSLSSS